MKLEWEYANASVETERSRTAQRQINKRKEEANREERMEEAKREKERQREAGREEKNNSYVDIQAEMICILMAAFLVITSQRTCIRHSWLHKCFIILFGFRILQDAPGCFRMLQDASGCFRMI